MSNYEEQTRVNHKTYNFGTIILIESIALYVNVFFEAHIISTIT